MDAATLFRAVGAFAITLGALLLMAWLLKRFSGGAAKQGPLPDLKVVGWRPLDQRRRMAVVRWGEAEHLVILGPAGETLIASRTADADLEKATAPKTLRAKEDTANNAGAIL